MRNRIVRSVSVWLLAACGVVHQGSAVAAESAAPAARVGVTRGVHAQILDEVKRVAAARGLGVDVVEFDDASRIDAALADGRIDAASFEDAQQLAATRARKRYALTEVAPTVTLPMALYSRKLKNLNELPPGATVAIPADRRGMARALVLLQNDTLVTLREQAGLRATLRDVTGNRLGLKFVALRRDRLHAALDTAAFVAIDSDDAARARQHRHRGRAFAVRERADGAQRRSRETVGRAARRRISLGRRRALHSHALPGFGAAAVVDTYLLACNACGRCCNSAPTLSLRELFRHRHRFVGALTIRRVPYTWRSFNRFRRSGHVRVDLHFSCRAIR